jgi:hypothetical protein
MLIFPNQHFLKLLKWGITRPKLGLPCSWEFP